MVVVISSPRSDGFGESIAARIVAGAESIGRDVKVYRLNRMRSFRPCQNCEACKKNGGECVLKDDLAPLMQDVYDAEAIVHVASIRFNDTDGMFKIYLDRFYRFLDISASTILPKGKKVATVVTASADQAAAEMVSVELEKIMEQHFFCIPMGRIAYCTWMMPPGMFADESVLEEAEEIGKRL